MKDKAKGPSANTAPVGAAVAKMTPTAAAAAAAPPSYQRPVVQLSGWVFVSLTTLEGAYAPVETLALPLVRRLVEAVIMHIFNCSSKPQVWFSL